MKFKPVDVTGKKMDAALADIARGLNSLHQCVHAGHEAQAERDEIADQKRAALAGEVGEIRAKQDVDSGRITKLAQMFGAAEQSPGEKAAKPKVGMGWREHAKIAGTIGACLGLFVFLYRLTAALAPAFHEFMLKVQT